MVKQPNLRDPKVQNLIRTKATQGLTAPRIVEDLMGGPLPKDDPVLVKEYYRVRGKILSGVAQIIDDMASRN